MTDSRSLACVIALDEIPSGGLPLEVVATEADCRTLAKLNGLPSVESLRATLLLRHEGRSGVRVTGEVDAAVVQTCVVSLEPFPATLREAVDMRFASAEDVAALLASRAGDPHREENEDEPDTIENNSIDVGALVAEHLTLGLDPYPRKPGAELNSAATGQDERESPFAVLRDFGKTTP